MAPSREYENNYVECRRREERAPQARKTECRRLEDASVEGAKPPREMGLSHELWCCELSCTRHLVV